MIQIALVCYTFHCDYKIMIISSVFFIVIRSITIPEQRL